MITRLFSLKKSTSALWNGWMSFGLLLGLVVVLSEVQPYYLAWLWDQYGSWLARPWYR